jgi:hypothetical protein
MSEKNVWISSECHKAIKQYLVDVENYDIGDFIEDAVFFAMDHLDEFEEVVGIEAESEDEGESEEEKEEEQTHDPKKGKKDSSGGGWY